MSDAGGSPLPGFSCTDLCDRYGELVSVAEPILRDLGGRAVFAGPIATVKVFEDNVLVRTRLEQPGQGRVLVVDGGGSSRCALLGDLLGAMAVRNGWSGVVVHGYVRDAAALARLPLGVRALGTQPRRSVKRGAGEVEVPLSFAGVSFVPGQWLYADADGIVLAPRCLA